MTADRRESRSVAEPRRAAPAAAGGAAPPLESPMSPSCNRRAAGTKPEDRPEDCVSQSPQTCRARTERRFVSGSSSALSGVT